LLACLRDARGRLIVVDDGSMHGAQAFSYADYEVDVDHLVSLVTIIRDEEFLKDLELINAKYDGEFKNGDSYDDFVFNQRLIYRKSFERFNACLRLLKRKGVIVEKLLEGRL
jgi:DNA-binding SARP family transcriptional activator